MTTLDAPQLDPPISSSSPGIPGWLDHNKWWILAGLMLLAGALLLYWLRDSTSSKRLQRDALEKLRKSLLESCRATRGPAKTIWLAGSPRDPLDRLGRYVGHHHGLECVWLAYRPSLFSKARIVCVNPVDLSALDEPEVYVRAIGLQVTRELTFAIPDVHDSVQRGDWQQVAHRPLLGSQDFIEEAKAFYSRAVDNALAVYDSFNAAEDRSFLRQEVTRSQDERTETISVPTQSTPPADDATNT